MNSEELKRFLASKGATFQSHKSGSGYLTVRVGDRTLNSVIHGGSKQLGTGLV